MVPQHFLRKSEARNSKSERGFTVIEVLVASAIIAMLSTLVLANVGARKTDLTRAAQKLALDIRRAQNLSLAPSDAPNCLYGLKVIDSTTYVVYKRPTCPLPRANPNNNNYGGDAVPVETITLDGAEVFPFASGLDVSFEPPEPVTYVNGNRNITLTIPLRAPNGQTKNVTVNRFGRVEIQ